MHSRHRHVALAPLFIAAVACAPSAEPGGAQAPATETPQAAAPTMVSAAAATYALELADAPQTYTLVDGVWEDVEARESLTLIRDVTLRGDLDGDGVDDLVVLLVQNSGGSGVFSYLAPLLSTGTGSPAQATFVGDRVALRGWAMEGQRVRLDVLQAGAEDAACCPGELSTRRWYLESGSLLEDVAEVTGRLNLAAIAGDWRLVGWDTAEPFTPVDRDVTLSVAEGQVSGFAGCNRYTGTMTDGESAGDLVAGPLAGTRMACPDPQMQVEDRYMRSLGAANRIGFFVGKLAISFNVGDAYGSLLFEPAPPQPTQ